MFLNVIVYVDKWDLFACRLCINGQFFFLFFFFNRWRIIPS